MATTVHADWSPRELWALHRKVVRILDREPAHMGFRTKHSGKYAISSLKPLIYEMLMTEQLTREEVLKALEEANMKVSPKFLNKILDRSSWKSEQKDNQSKRVHKPFKHIGQSELDAEILTVCRKLPPDRIDSRILCRYWEIVGRTSPWDNSQFLASCDLLNSLDRYMRTKVRLKLEDAPDWNRDIRSEEEVKAWIRFN